MGFSSEWLEQSYLSWRHTASARLVRLALLITCGSALLRTLGHLPGVYSLWTAVLLLLATCAVVFHLVRPARHHAFQILATVVLLLDVAVSLPATGDGAHRESLFPAILAVFQLYTFFSLPFYAILVVATFVSVVQTCSFLLLADPLHTNELLAIIVVHIWTNFTGIYLCSTADRLARNAFLSARNSSEAEQSAEFQSNRLNKLLASFLPYHLISQARHQITLYKPHLYNETYSQVSVAYGRLVGFESVLAQCSAIDAARVLKELDQRIDRLAAANGCTRVASEGITVVCSIPGIDSQHAAKLCRFAADLETLVTSFRDATGADVHVCVAVDSGSITAGVVGVSKWHYDVIGVVVDNALLMQSNAPEPGVYVSNETRRFLGATGEFELEKASVGWRLFTHHQFPPQMTSTASGDLFPVNKRFSLVTVPQAVNRCLQTIVAMNPATLSKTKTLKNKKRNVQPSTNVSNSVTPSNTIISPISQRFRNPGLEAEYHKETDHWFIPSLAISIFFLVVYGIYHMLVMPRLITSLALIVGALTVMFFILLMLYIDYFHTFSQFITRTSAGHAVSIILIIVILFVCGIVNTFSCPQPNAPDVCQKAHFSTYSFAMWTITTAVFVRFPSLYLAALLLISLSTYALQIWVTRPDDDEFGPREFMHELDLTCFLVSLAALVFVHSRRCEKLLRLDFLAVVKGVEETSTKDRLAQLNNQMMLNLVPAHVAPGVIQKAGDVWHHSHQSVGIAYIAVSGFDLDGEPGINGLNYVFSHFDQSIADFKGVEKVKSANRFYIVAVGLLPDAAQNVNETPWTIGELLSTLAHYIIHISRFAVDNEFHVQIGVDCGSTLAVVTNTDQPRYEIFGETLDRSRTLMQAAGHDTTLVSEEVFLALRPRPLRFSQQAVRVANGLNAYEMMCAGGSGGVTTTAAAMREMSQDEEEEVPTMPREEQERHTQGMVDAQFAGHSRMYDTQTSEMASSMASSFSSELRSIDGDAETDSDLEWITPETALMNRKETSSSARAQKFQMRHSDYDPYREPSSHRGGNPMRAMSAEDYQHHHYNHHQEHHKNRRHRMQMSSTSDVSETERSESRGPRTSRASSRDSYRRWRPSSKNSLRNGFGLFSRKGGAGGGSDQSTCGSVNQIEAAANRVDRMIQELNAFGDFADVKPLEYQPFPANNTFGGSVKSIHRAMSSACHTEYDNAESDAAAMSDDDDEDVESNNANRSRRSRSRQKTSLSRRWRKEPPRRWQRDAADGDTESQCSSMTGSIDLEPIRWKSTHSIGYENEYEMQSDVEGLALEEMAALSRDIRNNFGDFQLATFDDIDQD